MPPLPLPDGWSIVERVEDTVVADGLTLHRVGLSACGPTGATGAPEATGSAADWYSPPVARAQFELLERIAMLQAERAGAEHPIRTREGETVGLCRGTEAFPRSDDPRWAYARSSGVALHADWKTACIRAEQELVERDRILRAWLGEVDPAPLELDVGWTPLAKTRSYEWRACSFPPPDTHDIVPGVHVVGVFGFPKATGMPLVMGWGARTSTDEAIERATGEALQMLGFLWGEPIPDRLPQPAPTPMAHLEWFQLPEMHAVLRRWLEKGHRAHYAARLGGGAPRQEQDRGGAPRQDQARLGGGAPRQQQDSGGAPRQQRRDGDRRPRTRFVQLTPPWLHGQLHVAKAVCEGALPLVFGQAPAFGHLPPEMRLHPIA